MFHAMSVRSLTREMNYYERRRLLKDYINRHCSHLMMSFPQVNHNNILLTNIFLRTLSSARDIHTHNNNVEPIHITVEPPSVIITQPDRYSTMPYAHRSTSYNHEWFSARRNVITASSIGTISEQTHTRTQRYPRILQELLHERRLYQVTLSSFYRNDNIRRVTRIIADSIYGQMGARQNPFAQMEGRWLYDYNNSSTYKSTYKSTIKSNLYCGKIPLKLLKNYKNKICSICQSSVKISKRTIISVTNCDHVFHPSCINTWIESCHFNGCPDCRNQLDEKCNLYDEIEKTNNKHKVMETKIKYPRTHLKKQLSKYTFKRYPRKCY